MKQIKSFPYGMNVIILIFLTLFLSIFLVSFLLNFTQSTVGLGNIVSILLVIAMLYFIGLKLYTRLTGKSELIVFNDHLSMPQFFLSNKTHTVMFENITEIELKYGEVIILCEKGPSYGISKSNMKSIYQQELFQLLSELLPEKIKKDA